MLHGPICVLHTPSGCRRLHLNVAHPIWMQHAPSEMLHTPHRNAARAFRMQSPPSERQDRGAAAGWCNVVVVFNDNLHKQRLFFCTMHALSIGPFSLPTSLLIPAVATFAGLWAGERLLRRTDGRQQAQRFGNLMLLRVILPGLLLARLAYIVQFWPSYAAAPLTMLDIRDGGFNIWAGVFAAWLLALYIGQRNGMLRRPLMMALACMTAIGLLGQELLLAPSPRSMPLPTARFQNLEGEALSMQRFAGKPTVITLWATWCPHCKRSMPVLAEIQRQHPELNVVLLNQGESREQVQAFLQRHPQAPTRNQLLDPQKLAGQHFGVQAVPTTLFLDRQGRMIDLRIGALSHAALTQRIQQLLAPSI